MLAPFRSRSGAEFASQLTVDKLPDAILRVSLRLLHPNHVSQSLDKGRWQEVDERLSHSFPPTSNLGHYFNMRVAVTARFHGARILPGIPTTYLLFRPYS
jgi:hypothetical protein